MPHAPKIVLAGLAMLLASCAGRAPEPLAAVPERKIARERTDDPEEAQRFYLLRRSPSGGEIPFERYIAARTRMLGMPTYRMPARAAKESERGAGTGSWEELGPSNFGGRTRSLVINPQNPDVMYAGAVLGGVWKTTNGGASWSATNDLLPNIGIGALAMDLRNPDVLFAATGEWFSGGGGRRGFGIFKTTDGGAAWEQLPSTANSSFYFTNRIVISPHDSQRVYAATYGGVWRSLNGGSTWTRTLARAAPNLGCQDLVIRSDESGDSLLAACLGPETTTLFRNRDAGGDGEWETVFTTESMGRTSLALAASNQNIVYAMAASREDNSYRAGLLGVWRSDAGGEPGSWTLRVDNRDSVRLHTSLLSNPNSLFGDLCNANGTRTFSNQGEYDNTLAVDPVNPDIVWAGGIDLFRSDDGGRSWGMASYWNAARTFRTYAHADHHLLLFHPKYDGSTNQILFNANDGGLFRTSNARAAVALGDRAPCNTANSQVNWAALNNGYGVAQFYHGTAYPGGHFYFGGNQDLGTLRGSEITGKDWDSLIGGDGGYAAVDPANHNRIYGETQRNTTRTWFRRSDNSGASFQAAMNGITDVGDGTRFLFITPYVLDPHDSKRIYLGGKILWRTTDGADRWEPAARAFPDGITSAIAVSPQDPNRVLAGTSTGAIYTNTSALGSGAETEWAVVKPRTGFVSSIVFDPGNHDVVYATYSTFDTAGNSGHVFRSDDGGVTWNRADGAGAASIPDLPVNIVAVNPSEPSTLYAGSDLGVFVSTDRGASWARDDSQLPNTVVEWLQIVENNGPVLYAFTYGRGVWRARLTDAPACDIRPELSRDAPAFGGRVAVRVAAAPGCAWSTIGDGGALFESPASGSGEGTAQLTVPVNTTTVARVFRPQLANKRIEVTQARPVFPGSNDDIARPFRITELPFVGVQDTRPATNAQADPVHSCTNGRDGKTVWLSLVPDFQGRVGITSTGTRYDNGQTYNPVLAVYSGGGATEIACAAATPASVEFSVQQGTTYLIQMSGRATDNVGGYTAVIVRRIN